MDATALNYILDVPVPIKRKQKVNSESKQSVINQKSIQLNFYSGAEDVLLPIWEVFSIHKSLESVEFQALCNCMKGFVMDSHA